jgi:tetratricopeptide (TPR) repeat protein
MTQEELAGASGPGRAGPVMKSKHVKPEHTPDVAGRSEAIAWLSAVHAAAIPAAMHTFLRSQGRWYQAMTLHHSAIEVAREIGAKQVEARALTELGTVQQMSGAHDEAKESLDRAVLLYEGLGDASGEAEALNNLGELALRTADHSSARDLHERALEIATRIVAPREQARAHEGIGRSYLAEGEIELGETSVRQAVQIYQQIGSPHATRAAKLLSDHGN